MVWLAGILLPAPDAQGGAQVALKETVVITDPLGRFRARFIAGYAKESRTLLEDLKMRLGGQESPEREDLRSGPDPRISRIRNSRCAGAV